MSDTKLLPCPFCGGKAVIKYHNPLVQVFCKSCGCGTGATFEKLAIKAWNTRKPIDRIVEQLEEYEDSHLIERDSEQCEHCAEKSYNDCEGMDCSLCVWNKAIEIVKAGGKDERIH